MIMTSIFKITKITANLRDREAIRKLGIAIEGLTLGIDGANIDPREEGLF
jgi:hypothetical protein